MSVSLGGFRRRRRPPGPDLQPHPLGTSRPAELRGTQASAPSPAPQPNGSRPGQAGHDDHSYGITEYLRPDQPPQPCREPAAPPATNKR